MSRPPFEVADLIRTAGATFIERNRKWIRWKHVKVLLAIARCRTAALGGHLDQCTRCGHRATISYNSCRNRHCPKCQTAARDRWISARQRELLPTRYVHVVFTLTCSLLPHETTFCSTKPLCALARSVSLCLAAGTKTYRDLGGRLVVVYCAQASDNYLLLHGLAHRVPNDYVFLGPISR